MSGGSEARVGRSRRGLPLRRGTYFSSALGRTQEYGYLADDTFLDSPDNALVILLHGLNGSRHDWYEHTRIASYLVDRPLVVVLPDCDNGWLTNAVQGGERREDDIVLDLLGHLKVAFPAARNRSAIVGGLSMGGYGAVKLALKYPDRFRAAFSHSGAFDIAARGQPHPVFGDPQRDAAFRRRQNPFWLAEQALCRLPTERPALFIDCGDSDPLLEVNRAFSDHLEFIGYGHRYREMRGHHTWPYWDRAFRTVLPELLADHTQSAG